MIAYRLGKIAPAGYHFGDVCSNHDRAVAATKPRKAGDKHGDPSCNRSHQSQTPGQQIT